MKVILSRKGFDSQYGGLPSPIMPDGTLLSFPIPDKNETLLYSELQYSGKTYLEIIKELKPRTKIKDTYACHLDPDLRQEMIVRDENWKPLFGQVEAAQGHLANSGIKKGDLFLFFGWFKEVDYIKGVYKYKRKAPDLHVIFGYLQIGDILNDMSNLQKEFKYHAHAQATFKNRTNNCLYVAAENLNFAQDIKGGGCLTFHNDLVLTKQGYSRSKWMLPDFFKNVDISYHKRNSFSNDFFQSAAKGQEFVIQENEEVSRWAKELIIKGVK